MQRTRTLHFIQEPVTRQSKLGDDVRSRTHAIRMIAQPMLPPHIGNQQVLRALGLHARLAVSQPADPEEVEADRAADAFVAGESAGKTSLRPSTPRLSRKCAACSQEEDGLKSFARKTDSSGATVAGSHPISRVSNAIRQSQGRPIPSKARHEYERFFNADLSGLRIHTDAHAQEASREVSAHAFARGGNIYFAANRFDTNAVSGRHLLAHEIAHTLQQNDASTLYREGASAEQLQDFWARPPLPIWPGLTYSLQPTPWPWTMGDLTKTSPVLGYALGDATLGQQPSGIPPLSTPPNGLAPPAEPPAPWTPERLYPNVYPDTLVNRFRAASAAQSAGEKSASGAIPEAALTMKIPPPYSGGLMPRAVSDVLGMPFLAGVAGFSGLLGGIAEGMNSKHPSSDLQQMSKIGLGTFFGLAGGAAGKFMQKPLGEDANASAGWGAHSVAGVAPSTSQDRLPTVSLPSPLFSLGVTLPLNAGLFPYLLDPKQ